MFVFDTRWSLAGVTALCLAVLMTIGSLAFLSIAAAQPAEVVPTPVGTTSIPASIPVQRKTPGRIMLPEGNAWRIGFALTGVFLAIAAILSSRQARRESPWWRQVASRLEERSSAGIECLSSMRLSPRHSLHVVCWEGRRLLVGCSDHAILLLAESPGGRDAAATPLPVVGTESKGVPWAL